MAHPLRRLFPLLVVLFATRTRVHAQVVAAVVDFGTSSGSDTDNGLPKPEQYPGATQMSVLDMTENMRQSLPLPGSCAMVDGAGTVLNRTEALNDYCKDSNNTIVDARRLVVKFAPFMYFHYLELYHLDNVTTFLGNAKIYHKSNNSFYANASEANIINLYQKYGLEGTKNFALSASLNRGGKTDKGHKYSGQALEDGRSTAPVYYTVKMNQENGEKRGTFLYTFFMFYSWRGCSNQQIIYTGTKNDFYAMDFDHCPLGSHEGYFTYIQVEVCHDLQRVLRTNYASSDFNQQYNCLKRECYFQRDFDDPRKNLTNPIVFSSLFSHQNHAKHAMNLIYDQFNVTVNRFVDAYNLVDRPYSDGFKIWMPLGDLLVPLYEEKEYNLTHELRANKTGEYLNTTWALFLGDWGTQPITVPPLQPPECFDSQQRQTSNCSEPHLAGFINIAMYYGAGNAGPGSLPASLSEQTSPGPMSMDVYSKWENFRPSRLSSANRTKAHCVDQSQLSVGVPSYATLTIPSDDGFFRAWVGCAALAATSVIFFTVSFVGNYRHAPFQAGTPLWFRVFYSAYETPWLTWVGLLVAAVGYYLIVRQASKAVKYLDMVTSANIWSIVDLAFVGVLAFILLCDVLLALQAVFASGYASQMFGHSRAFHGCLSMTHFVFTFLTVLAGVLSAVVFGTCLASACVSYVFITACAKLAQLNGVCLDLSTYGLKDVACGQGFQVFCRAWQGVINWQLVAGALLFVGAQLTFMVNAGLNYEKLARKIGLYYEQLEVLQLVSEQGATASNRESDGRSSLHSGAMSGRSDYCSYHDSSQISHYSEQSWHHSSVRSHSIRSQSSDYGNDHADRSSSDCERSPEDPGPSRPVRSPTLFPLDEKKKPSGRDQSDVALSGDGMTWDVGEGDRATDRSILEDSPIQTQAKGWKSLFQGKK